MSDYKNVHPLYTEHLSDWDMVDHAFQGERIVKEQGETYLPATQSMRDDGYPTTNSKGLIAYNAYRKRAVFPHTFANAVSSLLGILHRRPPKYILPKKMEPLLEHCTSTLDPLEAMHRKINEHQIRFGRCLVMADLPDTSNPGVQLPYLALYAAQDFVNWDADNPAGMSQRSLRLAVVKEQAYIRDGFSWKQVARYRALDLADGVYTMTVYEDDPGTKYTPSIGTATLDHLPAVVINTQDLDPSPETPPLLGLAALSMSIYRLQADYRQALFMQGQDTLVVPGGDPETAYRTGAGAVLTPPAGNRAEFIGVNSQGLAELRHALNDDMSQAALMGAQLINTTSRAKESGDALQIRVAAQTATLNQIAITGANGLLNILKTIATWMGENPEEVEVEPNLDFSSTEIDGRTMVDIMTAKQMGWPISVEDLHAIGRRRGLTENAIEITLGQIEGEPDLGSDPMDPNPTGFNTPGGAVDDEDEDDE